MTIAFRGAYARPINSLLLGAGAGALVSTLHNGTADGGYHHPPWRRCAALFAAFGATSVGSNAGAAVIERNFLHNYSAIS